MALRRELLPLLLAAAFLLIGPAQALAEPTWLNPQFVDQFNNTGVPADVAADADGNAVAIWIGGGEVRAAYRPRGGDWGPPENLDPGAPIFSTQPRVTVQPNGQFVAVWLGAAPVGGDHPLRWARRPAGGDWTAPGTIGGIACCPDIPGLEAGGDGSVTVMAADESVAFTHRKPPGSETWGGRETLPWTAQSSRLAVGSDGSAVAIVQDFCGAAVRVECIVAAHRARGVAAWGPPETVGLVSPNSTITGYEVAASGDAYSVVWGEGVSGDGFIGPPGAVRSADRASGVAGGWSAPQTVAALPNDAPFCPTTFDNCMDLAVGANGPQLAAWHESDPNATNPRILAALRAPGGDWGSAEVVGATGTSDAIPFAGLTTSGVPVVVWGSQISGQGVPHTAYRAGADEWRAQTPAAKRPRGVLGGVALGDLATDGEGNALTAWEETTGAAAAGFDAAGPRFTAFSLPSGGSLTFSAAATDNWSGPPGISWLFGDGSGASGGTVSHAYGSPGTFTATATATDQVGNAAQQSGPVTVTQTPPPPGDPCGTADTDKDGIKNGCDESNGAARPRPFKTVNATVVSGEVFVKLPGGSASAAQRKAPKGFVPLEGAETIPVGSTVDTARGRVKIRSAATTGRKLQTGQFFRGRSVIRQARIKRRSKRLITDMRLTGSSFRRTCGANRASISQRKRSKKRVRRLFGNAKGRFRTTGRNAAATVRGTRWSVQDRCDGTKVTVQRGRVEVRDKVKRKTVIVRTGRTYLARTR